jgi:predicted transcriptional regulator
LALVASTPRVTARRAAPALGITHAGAGSALRALEREGLIAGELVGGGELAYRITSVGADALTQTPPG